jgi:hypothetical protein
MVLFGGGIMKIINGKERDGETKVALNVCITLHNSQGITAEFLKK